MTKLRPGLADTALALVFAAFAPLDIWLNDVPGLPEANAVSAALTTLPLAWRTRELHDVIGHSISVMGLQAGAVRRLLTPEQEREREALLSVERTGRDAVGEMRRLLGILRANGAEPELDAMPTVQRAGDLVAELRRAGLDDFTPGRALAAFRILQEALTNCAQARPRAHVEAVLRRTAAELEIEVVDSGGDRPAEPGDGGGHGLVGMQERVALYGGTLDAGPAGGGFAVLARFPATGA